MIFSGWSLDVWTEEKVPATTSKNSLSFLVCPLFIFLKLVRPVSGLSSPSASHPGLKCLRSHGGGVGSEVGIEIGIRAGMEVSSGFKVSHLRDRGVLR